MEDWEENLILEIRGEKERGSVKILTPLQQINLIRSSRLGKARQGKNGMHIASHTTLHYAKHTAPHTAIIRQSISIIMVELTFCTYVCYSSSQVQS